MGCRKLTYYEQKTERNEFRMYNIKKKLTFNKSVLKERSAYLYGFNGQEKDDEVSGAGNSYTAEFWQYDSRLGRRWNIDPVVYAWQSSYAAFNNNPVYFADPSGAIAQGEKTNGGDGTVNNSGKGTVFSQDKNGNITGNLPAFEITAKGPKGIFGKIANLFKSVSKAIGNVLKKVGNVLRNYDNKTIYKDDDFVKPIKTGLGGERPVGDGRQTNQGFLGDPSKDDETGITPGAVAGGISPTGLNRVKGKDVDDFGDLFQEGSAFFHEIAQGFDAFVEQLETVLSGGNDDTVEENTQKTHVNVHTIPDTDTIVNTYEATIFINKDGTLNSGSRNFIKQDTIKKTDVKNYNPIKSRKTIQK